MPDTPWKPVVIEGGKQDDEPATTNDHNHDYDELHATSVAVIEMVSDYTETAGTCLNCTMNSIVMLWFFNLVQAIGTLDPADDNDRETAQRGFDLIDEMCRQAQDWKAEEQERWDS